MTIRESTVADLARALEQGATVIDVRNSDEYIDGHIPGAQLFPLDELGDRMADLPGSRPLYVVCKSGRRSSVAAETLKRQGIDAISVVGGTDDWAASGRALGYGPRRVTRPGG